MYIIHMLNQTQIYDEKLLAYNIALEMEICMTNDRKGVYTDREI